VNVGTRGSLWRRCAVSAVAVLTATGCTSAGGIGVGRSHVARPTITVASFDFPESRLLAELYGQALRVRGYPVSVVANAGARELVEPALSRGLVDLVPEYAGSALEFLTLGATPASSDVGATYAAVSSTFARRGLVALHPAPAQDGNAIVVTQRTASDHGLRTISDLAAIAPRLTFGGPPECPSRPFCLQGLERVYGLRFRQFYPLDTGGPVTLQALRANEIDVALLFSTDPGIRRDGLVVLQDDRGLQPAENVVPVVRRAVLGRYGPALARVIDAVSAELSSTTLSELDDQVGPDGARAAAAAERWLQSHGLG
jgi:osmoprotectant transport system substrate-binding protein